jgi:hypothetical protein
VKHHAYMIFMAPAKGAPYTLGFEDRQTAEEAAQRLVAAQGGHASLHLVQHLQDYWHRASTLDRDLVA